MNINFPIHLLKCCPCLTDLHFISPDLFKFKGCFATFFINSSLDVNANNLEEFLCLDTDLSFDLLLFEEILEMLDIIEALSVIFDADLYWFRKGSEFLLAFLFI